MQQLCLAWISALFAIAPLLLSGCAGSPAVDPEVPSPSSPVVSPPTPSVSASPLEAETSPATLSEAELSEAEIWSQLRQGRGYVILFRHALAPGTGDPSNFRLEDCSTQRNLSAEGRQQAMRLGEMLRQRNIPVSRVLSSQWCRCLETARLMNLGAVEPFPVLNSFFQDRSIERSQTEQLRQFILSNRDTVGVTIMVTHQVNITAISNIIPQSGAAVVMRASAPDQIDLVGQLASR
ncbi:histidine phosphatase family protein [Oscillatoria sp. FACHB-1407]|uniref:histidine phosphatase family protein n=1 Tax=Oscillatoria sp. FACHB-1407 TaxID=2692847 RepID=UPI001684B268|nr:histidine phosphatase family protein [Oscillatoria sp. FACHB-1407]MBD2460935.1 histidine phosphatase family protein [Oscillatoria sp. FACHB-1407]